MLCSILPWISPCPSLYSFSSYNFFRPAMYRNPSGLSRDSPPTQTGAHFHSEASTVEDIIILNSLQNKMSLFKIMEPLLALSVSPKTLSTYFSCMYLQSYHTAANHKLNHKTGGNWWVISFAIWPCSSNLVKGPQNCSYSANPPAPSAPFYIFLCAWPGGYWRCCISHFTEMYTQWVPEVKGRVYHKPASSPQHTSWMGKSSLGS